LSTDVILITFCGEVFGIIPFIRTLRTTGSKATVIAFIDKKAKMKLTTKHFLQLKGCNLNFKEIGDWPFVPGRSVFFIPMADYLYKQQQYVRRVILADGFDIIFQGNPFTENFENEKIMFFSETQLTFKQLKFQIRLFHSLPLPDPTLDNFNVLVINSGMIAGSCLSILKLLDLYLKYLDYHNYSHFFEADQMIFNYLIYKGFLSRYQIEYLIDPPNGLCSVLIKGNRSYFLSKTFGKVLSYDNKTIALIVHFYDRFNNLFEGILKFCFKENIGIKNLMRKNKLKLKNKIEKKNKE
jgi:hypothetical protein